MASFLLERTQQFALAVIALGEALPRTDTLSVIRRQMIRSATSVAANYRAARRARSRREFVAKLGIVEEEADETLFWLELLEALGTVTVPLAPLRQEAHEIVAMTVASKRTAGSPRR